MNEASTRQLIDDLRVVVADAEALLTTTAHDVGDKARAARARASESVEHARQRIEELETGLRERADQAADDASRYVREHPWQAVGIAVAAGVVLGVLLGRR